MATGTAKTKYVRISPRKARLVADMIRGKSVVEARAQLSFSPLKGAVLLGKTLRSAEANALQQPMSSRESLVVLEVRVDEGPRLKRAKSRSKGSSVPVVHKLSHFTIVVGEV